MLCVAFGEAGLMQRLDSRVEFLPNLQSVNQYNRLAHKDFRRTAEGSNSPRTTDVLADLAHEAAEDIGVPTASLEGGFQVVGIEGDSAELTEPYAYVEEDKVYCDGELIDLAYTLKDNVAKHTSYKLPRFDGRRDRSGDNTKKLGIGFAISLSPAVKPIIELVLVRNLTISRKIFDQFIDSLNEFFGGHVEFVFRQQRWLQTASGLSGSKSDAQFHRNYFTRAHNTVRPGLNFDAKHPENSTRISGSIGVICSWAELKDSFGGVGANNDFPDQAQFLITSKHVAFGPLPPEDGNENPVVLSRMFGEGPKSFADVISTGESAKWKLNRYKYPFDIALARIRDGVEASKILSPGDKSYAIRLCKPTEYKGFYGKTQRINCVAQSGHVDAKVKSWNAEIPFQIVDNLGAVFLSANGAIVVSSVDSSLGREGNSGGSMSVEVGEADGSTENAAFGIIVANDKGAARYSDEDDWRAPRMIGHPIAAIRSELLAIFTQGSTLESEMRNQETQATKLSAAEQEYLDFVEGLTMKPEEGVRAEVLDEIKWQVRKLGGRVLRAIVSERDGHTVVEVHLSNRELPEDLKEVHQIEDVDLELIPAQRMFKA